MFRTLILPISCHLVSEHSEVYFVQIIFHKLSGEVSKYDLLIEGVKIALAILVRTHLNQIP